MSRANCDCDSGLSGNKTLLQLRTEMMRRLGYSAQAANPPPGMADLLDSFLRDSQDQLYLQYKEFRTERFFKWRTAVGGRFYGLANNTEDCPVQVTVESEGDNFLFVSEDAAGDGDSGSENALGTVSGTLGGAPLAAFGYLGDGPPGGGDPVYVIGIASAVENEQLPAGYWDSVAIDTPTGLLTLQAADASSTVQTGGGISYWYFVAPTNQLTVGGYSVTFSLPTSTPTFVLDPNKVTWVGTEDNNSVWQELQEGIDPASYTRLGVSNARPQRYEIRSCVEIFPAPEQAYSLWIKGHFGIAPFEEDADVVTIDDRAVFLLALGNAKAHYRQPDASGILRQAGLRVTNLVAAGHHTACYVPGKSKLDSPTRPVFIPAPDA